MKPFFRSFEINFYLPIQFHKFIKRQGIYISIAFCSKNEKKNDSLFPIQARLNVCQVWDMMFFIWGRKEDEELFEQASAIYKT